jgi:hypothetical protein
MKKIRNFLHHLLVPGKHNNHLSHATSHGFLTFYLAIAIFSLTVLPNLRNHGGGVLGFATDIDTKKLLDTTNRVRISNGLSPLKENSLLTIAASKKADDMFEKNYWSHFGPSGETPWAFIIDTGYEYEYAGENLAKNFMFSEDVVSAWMDSKAHRENILNGRFDEVGYAVANGNLNGEDTTLVVQMFGTKTISSAQITKEKNDVSARTNTQGSAVIVTPSINLLPAYQFMSGVLVSFLILAFAVDLYHISKTDHHRHRGKHIAHLIFLIASLIGIFMIGSGAII